MDVLVPERAVVLLSSPSIEGRAAFLTHLCTALLAGRKVLQRFATSPRSDKSVLFFNREMDGDDLSAYFKSARRGLGVTAPPPNLFVVGNGTADPLQLGDGSAESMEPLKSLLRKLRPMLVVLDTYRPVSASQHYDPDTVFELLAQLAQSFGCAFLVGQPTARGAPVSTNVDLHISLADPVDHFFTRMVVSKNRRLVRSWHIETHKAKGAFTLIADHNFGTSRLKKSDLDELRFAKLVAAGKPLTSDIIEGMGVPQRTRKSWVHSGRLVRVGRDGRWPLYAAKS